MQKAGERDPLLQKQKGSSSDASPDEGQSPDNSGTCLTRTNLLLYFSHFLSAWGDRMWQFATGMFLVSLNPTSLQLTAVYGFTSGGSILFMGAIVGHWVDKYRRLTVARTALVVQNVSVAMSAMAVCLTLYFQDEIKVTWGGSLETICHVIIIAFAVVADVASMGRTISIERDWIVVICGDEERLTNMSAFLRRIDLTTKLLAPVLTGQVITYGSSVIGAILIASWNLVSVCVEYMLLYKVYSSCPLLAFKQDPAPCQEPTSETIPSLEPPIHNEKTPLMSDCLHTAAPPGYKKDNGDSGQRSGCSRFCVLFLDSFITLFVGWKLYARQSILLAGLALATIYMTVLGFDNITSGFAKEQGLSESVIGILMAAGACLGITGTVIFPYLRAKLGLAKTGIISLLLQNTCLTMCVVSIWLPGSPFDPGFLTRPETTDPCVLPASPDGDIGASKRVLPISVDDYGMSYGVPMVQVDSYFAGAVNCSSPTDPSMVSTPTTSVIVLMAGIVFARFGLWMADLTVTQLLLETPPSGERGKVNGVQNSLNQMMDMIKFLLVIFLPWPQTFGLLILVSYAFVTAGMVLYSIYVCLSTRRQNGSSNKNQIVTTHA